jgi:hypothetical protein
MNTGGGGADCPDGRGAGMDDIGSGGAMLYQPLGMFGIGP